MKAVCDLYITGELTIQNDAPFTPHRVALAVKEYDGLSSPPSTGAVQAVFKRWEKLGFATFKTNPFAFDDYTEEGKMHGLQGMLERKRAERNDSKANTKR